MGKTTVQASSDIALIKYWGKKDEELRLPENGSVSLILDGLETITTVEFDDKYGKDEVTIQGESDEKEIGRVITHLDRVRKMADIETFAKVVSKNTFPKGTGLSSSGSGFAALTVAAIKAVDLNLSEKEMSILARQGSGTACRCVNGGIVEWLDGDNSETSYAETIFPADYWDIRDVVVVVDEGKKKVSSTEGHSGARTSIFYERRLEGIKNKIEKLKKTLKEKDFERLGNLVEEECLEFHSILLTMRPTMIAWYPGTVEVMLAVRGLREDGIPAYFTINTGFNVHVLTLPEHVNQVRERMESLGLVRKVIEARVGSKPREIKEHLF